MHPLNTLLAATRKGDLPAPGVYPGQSREEYFAWPCLNASLLKHAAKSAAHFQAQLRAPDTPTDQMRFGTFAHCGQLEPLAIVQRYAVMPDLTEGIDNARPKATNEYKQRREAWEAQNQGREVVEQAWLDALIAMNRRLFDHDRARQYLGERGPAEVALVWDDPSGVRCKALADKLSPALRRIVDYKTTRDVEHFDREVLKFGYDVQGAFYADGAFALTGEPHAFCLVAQEKDEPYTVRAAPLSEMNLICGRRIYRDALARVLRAIEAADWPTLADPDQWERPAWDTPSLELCVNGELVTL